MIVHPHGGPWARDRWGFDPELQFLASRGYAVLQINFRSSAGFGRRFLEAGFGQWGLGMQDDITDGVRWPIAGSSATPPRSPFSGAGTVGSAPPCALPRNRTFMPSGFGKFASPTRFP